MSVVRNHETVLLLFVPSQINAMHKTHKAFRIQFFHVQTHITCAELMAGGIRIICLKQN